MKRSFLMRALLGAALFSASITEDAPSAAGAHTDDAAAGAASAAGEANGGAFAADATDASGSPASAEGAPGTTGTAATDDKTPEPTALADTDFHAPLSGDPTPGVSIDIEDHAEARERFAGLMAKLHGFENDSVEQLRVELRAIAELLHLHSVASGMAESTGSYSPDDL